MQAKVGDEIPQWVMESVSAQRMCTMAAILRDPNPLHWDRDKVDSALGIGKRTINQGPLGLSYMINMLHLWAGENCIRKIFMNFPMPLVLDGDRVVAKGEVTSVKDEDQGQLLECHIWLEGDLGTLLDGTATVFVSA
ncbi:MAG: protein dehydratase [Halieaceae bacterium]|jgi:acyl dehydratase|nr:protein dehydratase [Halieaceae bacterium]